MRKGNRRTLFFGIFTLSSIGVKNVEVFAIYVNRVIRKPDDWSVIRFLRAPRRIHVHIRTLSQ